MSNTSSLDVIASLCKRRGFIFHSSEVYGGINGFWDYGPLGCEMKRNIKEDWWKTTVRNREDVAGLDATIIMHPAIWKASGHLDTFSDPMCTCRACKKLMRADQVWDILADGETGQSLLALLEGGADAAKVAGWCKGKAKGLAPNLAAVLDADTLTAAFETLKADPAPYATVQALYTLLANAKAPQPAVAPCPYCGGELTEPRPFNLMFKTVVGPIDDPANIAYLRPETAQAIFAQFQNVLATSRMAVPFGIAQMGKSFRNEVTPRNYTFRSREFEQMELEFFIRPDEAVELICGRVTTMADKPDLSVPQDSWGWEVWHKYWVERRKDWIVACGLPQASFVEYWQKPEELAHYARACVDIEYSFPFGVQELEGIAARSDFDLSQHQKHSGKSMEVFDEPLKLAAAKLDDAAKAAFADKVASEWCARGKDEAAARAFTTKLFEGKYVPHVIEPSAGVDRMMLALLCNAYEEQKLTDDKGKEDTRIVMHFSPRIAPVKVAVFPLLKNKPEVYNKARGIFEHLRRRYPAFWDESGAIGRRYRRQDEIGTPWCVTIDFQTLEDDTVTVRDRDSMQQERLTLEQLKAKLDEALIV
ncbi:MAG TPA: glycine--tRNA ligase [Kiritimatiellia bacterium]|jgi:glycyl-tRNA synthetase|nr:MAG: Glycine--tRNA ligase [Verrucomicrobia bacterium ADurb.Bin070]HQL49827.1 glycine--tRNA ligase [Kiritimatiellia bacterium]